MKKFTYRHTIYACYTGYITQAIVNNLLPLLFIILQDTYRISLQKITLLITFNFFVQLLVDTLSIRFADKVGYRQGVVAAHVFSAAGLIGLSVFPELLPDPFAGLMVSVILYAVGGGLIEVLISPIVEACPSDNKEAAMSLLHSFYCWGTVAVIIFSTCFILIFGRDQWRILACLWSIVPAVNAWVFTKVPISSLNENTETLSFGKLFTSGMIWFFVLLMIAAGASEQGMSQWASVFAERALGVSKFWGDLFGACMFSLLMGTSRFLYSKYADRLDLMNCIILSAALCLTSYLLAALSPWPILALAGCGICGFSVGIFWPGVFSLAAKKCPCGGTPMFALLALAGDIGCSSGPTVVGMAASAMNDNIKYGLIFAIVFPLILIIGCSISKKLNHQ